MMSDLSTFAAQLREFIAFSTDPRGAARAGRDAEFNELALALFALQFRYNPPYRKFCESRRAIPGTIASWPEIPAMPTAAFKEFELSCLPMAERTTVFHSSGTTAHRPSRHFHSAESLAIYEASLWPWFRKNVLADLTPGTSCQGSGAVCLGRDAALRRPRPRSAGGIAEEGTRVAPLNAARTARRAVPTELYDHPHLILLAPPPFRAPHSSLVHMFEVVRRELRAPDSAFVSTIDHDGSWVLDFDAAGEQLRAAQAGGRPAILLGTAFSFVHLLDELAVRKLAFNLPPGSRAMETGGYKGRSREIPRPELHALIARRLGIPAHRIVCEYGMSELSSQAYDGIVPGIESRMPGSRSTGATQNSKLKTQNFRFPPWVRARVISPETGHEVADGEPGLLRVVDLANVFSVLAVQTEDLAVRRDDGFELLGRAEAAEPRGCSLMSAGAVFQIVNPKS